MTRLGDLNVLGPKTYFFYPDIPFYSASSSILNDCWKFQIAYYLFEKNVFYVHLIPSY